MSPKTYIKNSSANKFKQHICNGVEERVMNDCDQLKATFGLCFF